LVCRRQALKLTGGRSIRRAQRTERTPALVGMADSTGFLLHQVPHPDSTPRWGGRGPGAGGGSPPSSRGDPAGRWSLVVINEKKTATRAVTGCGGLGLALTSVRSRGTSGNWRIRHAGRRCGMSSAYWSLTVFPTVWSTTIGFVLFTGESVLGPWKRTKCKNWLRSLTACCRPLPSPHVATPAMRRKIAPRSVAGAALRSLLLPP